MNLKEEAELHVQTRRLRRRNPVYAATRFAKLVSRTKTLATITTEDLIKFRNRCVELGQSPHGIESSIGDLVTMRFLKTGDRLDRGQRLKIPRPQPSPASLDQISAVYVEAEAWLQKYLALAYFSCARVFDSLQLLLSNIDPKTTVLRWTASKTAHRHVCPVPNWLSRHLKMKVTIPPGCPKNHLKRVLRRQIRDAAEAAGVESFTPQQHRQRGLTEWSRANAMAARIVHGEGLGTLDHYVDPLSVLESAAPALRLPEAFASEEERDEAAALPAILARMDPESRRIVMETAQRFAR